MKLTSSIFLIISMAILSCGGSAVYAQSLQLELITDPDPVVGFSESAPIKVRFSGVDRPIAGADVSFAPLSDTADTNLSVMRDITDSDGLAETMILAGVEAIDFDVEIRVPGYDVEPLEVHVRVASSAGLLEAEYPGDFSSMQEAIDALADGGTLRIAMGVHQMEPTYIRGKTVHIEGRGPNCWIPGRRGRWSFGTVLVAPRVDRVTDPEEVEGSWHYIDGGGSITGLRIIGGDAGIATRETRDGSSQPLTVSNACLTHMVRGIHHKANTPLHVSDTVIRRVTWNGMSIAPPKPLQGSQPNTVEYVSIIDPENVCLYFENTAAAVIDDYLVNCSNGGILAINSTLWVDETTIVNATKIAISLVSSWGDLFDNIILGTNCIQIGPNPQDCELGDGVMAWDGSTVFMLESNIWSSDRAAVSNYGSYVAIGDNRFRCQVLDLVGGSFNGNSFNFDDLENNLCGCPVANSPCQLAPGSPPEPPPPVGGLE